MSKQVRPTDHHVVCDVCGRTMLKGEQAEPYLAPSRERKLVCQLCAPRAEQEGWIRESASPETPAQPARTDERRRLFRRRGRQPPQEPAVPQLPDEPAAPASAGDAEAEPLPPDPPATTDAAAARKRRPRSRRDPRHVRAVPTNAQLKIERALDLFNASEHAHTVAGVARTLGSPQVCASTSGDSAAEVVITVAWELSWYQFAVDLSDSDDPVRMQGRGEELGELAASAREWNAHAESGGGLAIGVVKNRNGKEEDQVV